jgi:hypothetical protein
MIASGSYEGRFCQLNSAEEINNMDRRERQVRPHKASHIARRLGTRGRLARQNVFHPSDGTDRTCTVILKRQVTCRFRLRPAQGLERSSQPSPASRAHSARRQIEVRIRKGNCRFRDTALTSGLLAAVCAIYLYWKKSTFDSDTW